MHYETSCADRLKILIWDGSGLILLYKRLDDAKFRWPRIEDGIMRLSPAQASACSRSGTQVREARPALGLRP